jgi:hypothetical protein
MTLAFETDCEFAEKLFDSNFYRNDFSSIIKLIVYFPAGLLIFLLRLICVILLRVNLHFFPLLNTSSVFCKLVAASLGIRISVEMTNEMRSSKVCF